MLPWEGDLAGRLDRAVIESELLRDNPLGDPYQRPLWVYTPPGYDDDESVRFPAVYVIQGYTGHVAMWANRMPYRQPFIETADAVFAERDRHRPASSCTSTRGPRTADRSSSTRPAPGATTRTSATRSCRGSTRATGRSRHRESRAISGKSSGGFGAMITPMLRPDLFGALATHAGDTLYELCYIPEFGKAARALRDVRRRHHSAGGTTSARAPSFTKDADQVLLGLLGCAACFSARPDGTPELPFDPRTGAVRPEVWQRWLDWDPVRMVDRYADALRSLRRDLDRRRHQGRVLPGPRRGGVPGRAGADRRADDAKVHFELFEAGHGGIDYRYPLALEWLAQRLARE